jgi:hypothetical protein
VNDTSVVEAVLVPVGDPGLIVRTGAAVLVEETLLDEDVEFEYLERVLDPDAVGARFVGVEPGEHGVEDLIARWAAVLRALTVGEPELAGWEVRMSVAELSDDEDDEDDEDDGSSGPGEAAAELTPDQLAELLVEQIDYQQSVYADADLFRALPLGELLTREEDVTDPDGRAVVIRQATGLAGCLIQAAVVLVDQLFADVRELETADEAVGRSTLEITDTLVLSYLPSRYSDQYDVGFARDFLVAFVDLTRRLTCGWEPPACVAQELGLRILLNHVELIAESAGVDLDDDWRGHLEGLLFEDLDHEFLYDPAFDGIENDPHRQPPGMAPLGFEDWFRPFNDERSLPPFALPARPADALGSPSA